MNRIFGKTRWFIRGMMIWFSMDFAMAQCGPGCENCPDDCSYANCLVETQPLGEENCFNHANRGGPSQTCTGSYFETYNFGCTILCKKLQVYGCVPELVTNGISSCWYTAFCDPDFWDLWICIEIYGGHWDYNDCRCVIGGARSKMPHSLGEPGEQACNLKK